MRAQPRTVSMLPPGPSTSTSTTERTSPPPPPSGARSTDPVARAAEESEGARGSIHRRMVCP